MEIKSLSHITSTPDWNKWLASRPIHLIPRLNRLVTIVKEKEGVRQPLWTFWRGEKYLSSCKNQTRLHICRRLVLHHMDLAIPASVTKIKARRPETSTNVRFVRYIIPFPESWGLIMSWFLVVLKKESSSEITLTKYFNSTSETSINLAITTSRPQKMGSNIGIHHYKTARWHFILSVEARNAGK